MNHGYFIVLTTVAWSLLTCMPAPSSGDDLPARVAFNDDATRLWVYVQADERPPSAESVSCSINARPADVSRLSSIPLQAGGWLTCLAVEPPPPLDPSRAVVVSADLGLGDVYRWAGRAWNPFFAANSQYDFHLRVVDVAFGEGYVRLRLYNEADRRKRPLRVDRVRLDGIDVTHLATLPDPLPPDRQMYEEDARTVDIPVPSDRVGPFHVELAYATLDDGMVAGMTRTIDVVCDARLSQPVGGMTGSTLEGCVGICHEGLRPLRDTGTLRRLARRVHAVAPDRPVYAHLDVGTPDSRVAALGQCTDLLAIDVPTSLRILEDPIGALGSYMDHRRRTSSVPVLFCVGPEALCHYGPEDVLWLTLAALGSGSRGVLYRQPEDAGWADIPGCLAASERIAALLGSRRGVMSRSIVAPLRVEAIEPGIIVRTLASGTDAVIVIVLNEWCTRTCSQELRPFYGVLRDGCRLACDLGEQWQRPAFHAVDLLSGETLATAGEGASTTVMLPSFEAGRILLLSPREIETVSRPAARSATPPSGSLRLLTSPFISLGRVGTDSSFTVPLTIENVRDHPVQLSVSPRGVRRQPRVRLRPSSIPPGRSRIEATFDRVQAVYHGVAAYDLRSSDESHRDDIRLYASFSSHANIALSPARVDFGLFEASPPGHRIELKGSDERRFVIGAVEGDTHLIEIEIAPDRRSMVLTPAATGTGRFRGGLAVDAVEAEGDAREKLTIDFTGTRARFDVAPAQLVVTGASRPTTRSLFVRSAGDHFRITGIQSSSPALEPGPLTGACAGAHQLDVALDPARLSNTEELRLAYELRDRTTGTLTVPVRVVRPAAPASSGLASLHEQVGDVLRRARGITLDERWPPWAQMHLLLMFPENVEFSPSERTARDRILASLLGGEAGASTQNLLLLRGGRPYPRSIARPFIFEDHRDQLLHVLAVIGAPEDTRMIVEGEAMTVHDLLQSSLRDARLTGDTSWTCSAYSRYLPASHRWDNKFRQEMSLRRLVEYLLSQQSATCGGAHRLFALACARQRFAGTDGVGHDSLVEDLDACLRPAILAVRASQTASGAFLTPAGESELRDTGHAFEWMTRVMSSRELGEPWILATVTWLVSQVRSYLADPPRDPTSTRLRQWGAVSHAVSALARWHAGVRVSPSVP